MVETLSPPPPTEEARHLQTLVVLQEEYDVLAQEYEDSKQETAQRKAARDAKGHAIIDSIRGIKKQREAPTLPFEDAWRNKSLCDLGLPLGLLGILKEQGMETVGQIADYTKAGKNLTDLQYVGEKKAELIEAALDRFWKGQVGDVAPPAAGPEAADSGDQDEGMFDDDGPEGAE